MPYNSGKTLLFQFNGLNQFELVLETGFYKNVRSSQKFLKKKFKPVSNRFVNFEPV